MKKIILPFIILIFILNSKQYCSNIDGSSRGSNQSTNTTSDVIFNSVRAGSSTGISITGASGVGTIAGTGNTNNNGLNLDCETVAKLIQLYGNSDTGIRIKKFPTDVFGSVFNFNGVATYTDNTTEAGLSGGTQFTFLNTTSYKFYLGKSTKFTKIAIDFYTAASGMTLVAEYSKGSGVWGSLTVSDGTNAMTVDGTISFTAPADWATDTVNSSTGKYWVRLSASAITTAPAAFLVVPTNQDLLKVYSNANDSTAVITLDWKGSRIGINNESPNNTLSISGDIYATSSIQSATALRGNYMAVSTTANSALANDGSVGGSGTTGGTTVITGYYQVTGNGGAVTLDTDPAIGNGSFGGQQLTIRGTSNTNTVTIVDNCNIQLAGGASWVGGAGDTLFAVWDATANDWYEVSRSDN